MRLRMGASALVSLVLLAFHPAPGGAVYDPSVQSDYPRYAPSTLVKRYKHDPAALVEISTGKDTQGQKVDPGEVGIAYGTTLYGVFLLIILGICGFACCCLWNCCTCKVMDKKSCFACPESCSTPNCKKAQLCGGLLLLLLLFVFALLGLSYTNDDDTAIRAIPDVMGSMADRLEFFVTEVEKVEVLFRDASVARQNLIAFVEDTAQQLQINGESADVQNAIDESLDALTTAQTEIDDAALSGSDGIKSMLSEGAKEILSAQGDADDGIDAVQSQRHLVNQAILAVCIITGFCAGCVGVVLPATKEWARRWTKLYCCCSMGIITIMAIVFIMAAIYLIIVTIYSDACFDPTGWIIAAMGVPTVPADRSRDINATVYYIECGHYDTALRQSNWALSGLQDEIEQQCDSLTTATNDLGTTLSFMTGAAEHINNVSTYNAIMCNAIYSDTGLLGFNGTIRCATINSLFEEVLINVCEEIHNPIAYMFEFFVVIATILCLTECLQKATRRHFYDDLFDGDGSDGYDQYAMDEFKRGGGGMGSFRDLDWQSATESPDRNGTDWSPDPVTNDAYGGLDHIDGQPRVSDAGTWDYNPEAIQAIDDDDGYGRRNGDPLPPLPPPYTSAPEYRRRMDSDDSSYSDMPNYTGGHIAAAHAANRY